MPDHTGTEHHLPRELEQLSAAWDLAMTSNDATAVGYAFTATSRPFEGPSYFFELLLSISGAHFPSGP